MAESCRLQRHATSTVLINCTSTHKMPLPCRLGALQYSVAKHPGCRAQNSLLPSRAQPAPRACRILVAGSPHKYEKMLASINRREAIALGALAVGTPAVLLLGTVAPANAGEYHTPHPTKPPLLPQPCEALSSFPHAALKPQPAQGPLRCPYLRPHVCPLCPPAAHYGAAPTCPDPA